MKTLIQCDFDGTITEKDSSFLLLDAFARGDWRRLWRDYKEHKISVGEFNTRAFATVKADKAALMKALKGKLKVRVGFQELVNYCLGKGFKLVIVSNGLDFYVNAILKDLGLENIEWHAARTAFHPQGMKVQYIGPDGKQLEDGFKEAYTELFLKLGYRVIYAGNGDSDIAPARYAHYIFATGDLLTYCRGNNLDYKPFESFIDVVRDLQQLS